jgi:hypothetical protein
MGFPLPLVFPILGVALPLPFHHLLSIPGISVVAFPLPFQELFAVHRISGIALPPPFPLPCQPPFPILRIGGGVSCPLARAKFLRRLTLSSRHAGAPGRIVSQFLPDA